MDHRKLESSIVHKLKNNAMFQFQVAAHKIEKQLRAEMNLPPPKAESPKVYDLADDEVDLHDEVKRQEAEEDDVYRPTFDQFEGPVGGTESVEAVGDVAKEKDVEEEKLKDVEEQKVKDVEEAKADAIVQAVVAVVKEEHPVDAIGKEEHPGMKRTRSTRDRKPAAAGKSPFINPTKKAKIVSQPETDEYLPEPYYKPSEDTQIVNNAKVKMLAKWLKDNNESETVGLSVVVTQFDRMSAETIGQLFHNGKWLHTDVRRLFSFIFLHSLA